MEKLNFLKIMGLVGMVTDELINIQMDGKVTITECIKLVDKICNNLNIKFDIPDDIIEITEIIEERMRDKKTELNVKETVDFMGSIFSLMGMKTSFEFDDNLVEYLNNYEPEV